MGNAKRLTLGVAGFVAAATILAMTHAYFSLNSKMQTIDTPATPDTITQQPPMSNTTIPTQQERVPVSHPRQSWEEIDVIAQLNFFVLSAYQNCVTGANGSWSEERKSNCEEDMKIAEAICQSPDLQICDSSEQAKFKAIVLSSPEHFDLKTFQLSDLHLVQSENLLRYDVGYNIRDSQGNVIGIDGLVHFSLYYFDDNGLRKIIYQDDWFMSATSDPDQSSIPFDVEHPQYSYQFHLEPFVAEEFTSTRSGSAELRLNVSGIQHELIATADSIVLPDKGS